jgi:hypothetical protein
MTSLIWFSYPNCGHTYGIELMTTNKPTAENFLYNEIIPLCKEVDCDYFVQGLQLRDNMPSWVYVEFFGEGDFDKILSVIQKFNEKYYNRKMVYNAYYGNEILWDDPTKELLKELKLMQGE